LNGGRQVELYKRAVELTRQRASSFSLAVQDISDVIEAWIAFLDTLSEEEKDYRLCTFSGFMVKLRDIPVRLKEDRFFIYQLARVIPG